MSRLNFRLEAEASRGSRARAGRFRTLHNEVLTPLFMPVGTNATVKCQTFDTLETAGSQIVLANTYHLHLRPGPEVFKKFGGIHGFTKWPKSFLTDSGGFQIFSMNQDRTMTEEGAVFRSYVNGDLVHLTPERSIETHRAIGSDIMMVLDECVPSTCDRAQATAAMHLTHRWAARSLAARGDSPQSMFGIVQGACFEDLRLESARVLTQMPFDGFAIGGLAVGETKEERERFTGLAAEMLPRELPRYLMGVGTPIDLLEAVHRGVDMFDCILPNSLAQQGVAFTSRGRVRLVRGVHKMEDAPLDPNCPCPTCKTYSRGYLHHLIKASETLGWTLISTHNLYFYHRLMREMREAILAGRFEELYREKREWLDLDDLDHPADPPIRKARKDLHPRQLGNFEVVERIPGIGSLRQFSSGETMHPVGDPREEAERLYVEQSRLRERLTDGGPEELVVWDVGLGAGTNLMAAVQLAESLVKEGVAIRPLRIQSFENDLDALRLALYHPKLFRHICHAAPNALLKDGVWKSPRAPITVELFEGDFLERMDQAARPDLIFFDPFSYKADSPLWSMDCFRRILTICANGATELYTYSASTAVRATLLGAGFFVARGLSTGEKSETTVALSVRNPSAKNLALLDGSWIDRWKRSDARYPKCLTPDRHPEFELKILGHPQFKNFLGKTPSGL